MRAAVTVDRYRVELRDVPDPEPAPGEAVLRVGAVGLCGTDLHMWAGERSGIGFPLRQGHEIGVLAPVLERTVEEWNAFLRGGSEVDPAFSRVVLPPGRRTATTGPFTAVPMVIGVNFCSGGFQVTPSMQVIDVFGTPIPGLYAAGDCVGGLNPVSDLGGIRISGGFTLGRVAGRSAARGAEDTGPYPSVQGAFLPSMVDTKLALVHLPGDG